jgi:alpha-tubulin suppressor-like RCC1 family protein
VKQIASGRSHVCALLEDRTVRCWGRNTEGQLGGGVSGSRSSSVFVKGLGAVRAIASGHLHTCAVRDDRSLACWGDNSAQQLGAATTEPRSRVPVAVTAATEVELVAGGGLHTCARVAGGKVVCWGDDAKGQLGVAPGPARAAAVEVAAARRAIDLALGEAGGCALAKDGALTCWGAVEAPTFR